MARLTHRWSQEPPLATKFLTAVLQIAVIIPAFVWSSPSVAQPTCRQILTSRPLAARSIPEQKILAVHLTNYFPKDGFVRTTTANAGRFGVSLHFSLGQPVLDHASGNWSQRKFGVVVPLHAMRDQVLNLFPQDTFVLGDLKLPPNAVVFVPQGEPVPAGLSFKTLTYTPQEGLRETITRYIQSSGTVALNAPSEKVYAKVMLEGKNLNNHLDSKTYFKDLYADKPYITTTTHEETPWGKIDYQIIDYVSGWLSSGQRISQQDTSDVYVAIIKIQDSLAETQRVSKKMALPAHAEQSWKTGLAAIQGPLNLVLADFQLRRKHGKSVLETDFTTHLPLHAKIKSALFSLPELQRICQENLDVFVKIKKEQSEIWVDFVHHALVHSDMKTYKGRMKEVFPAPTQEESIELGRWGIIKAVSLLIEGRTSSEAALAEWNAHANPLVLKRLSTAQVESFARQAIDYTDRPTNPEVIRFFQSPLIRTALQPGYEKARAAYAKDKPHFLDRFNKIFGVAQSSP